MKKILFLAIAVTALGFTSCKKDHTCECKDDSTGTVLGEFTINNTKALAKTSCEASNTFGASGVTCKLK